MKSSCDYDVTALSAIEVSNTIKVISAGTESCSSSNVIVYYEFSAFLLFSGINTLRSWVLSYSVTINDIVMLDNNPQTYIGIANSGGSDLLVFFLTVATSTADPSSFRGVSIGESSSDFIPSRIKAFGITDYYVFGHLTNYFGTTTFSYKTAGVYQNPDLWGPSCVTNSVASASYYDSSDAYYTSTAYSSTITTGSNPI